MHTSDIGFLALILSMVTCVYVVCATIAFQRNRSEKLVISARNGVYVVAGSMLTAAAVLAYLFVTHDFSVEYVARNSSLAQPWYYTSAAFYGGQAGSLLMWATGLAVFSGIAIFANRRSNGGIMPAAMATLMTVQLFFLIVLIFLSNPFERLVTPLIDGQGLNPLLRDPGMLIHPPFLVTGYMSWTIPFAFAMGALISGHLDNTWLRAARPWLLVAWAIQSTGLLLGAWWAYHVLGWGGYWGWDPVENVALFPWLAGTALLHSIMVQERRGLLKKWNMLLVILCFIMSIFGTLVVRGGLLSSVHNFATSALGPSFLAFMGFALLVSLSLFFVRASRLKSDQRFDSAFSLEAGFLLNNLLFIGIGFATFWGTIFPLLTEAFDGSRITVGPPFYEKVNGPLLLAVLVLMGVAPLLAWRKSSWESLKRNFRLPLAGAFAWVGIMVGVLGITNWWTLAGVSACTVAFGTIVLEYYRGVRLRRRNAGEPYHQALGTLISRNRRRYGGYIVHIGVLLIAVAVIGSNLHQQDHEVTLAPGQSAELGSYAFTFIDIRERFTLDGKVTEANISVTKDGDPVGTMRPNTQTFVNFENQPATKIAIRSTLLEDVYIFLAAFDSSVATFVIFINPLVVWLWVGGGVFILGTVITLWPEKGGARDPLRQVATGVGPDET